jgi:hypothetical protein
MFPILHVVLNDVLRLITNTIYQTLKVMYVPSSMNNPHISHEPFPIIPYVQTHTIRLIYFK